MIIAEIIYNMIKKHSDIPLTSLPLLISEETPIPVPYEDIPVIIKQLENEGKVKIMTIDNEEYCQAIAN